MGEADTSGSVGLPVGNPKPSPELTPAVYLAGPMRGVAHQNFPAFHKAAEELRAKGYEVTNPAELDEAAGIDPDNPETFPHVRQLFRRDCEALLGCDAVAVLWGWTYSLGARAEVALARAVGMPVYVVGFQGSLLPLVDRGL